MGFKILQMVRSPQGMVWVFTLNNYADSDWEGLKEWSVAECKYAVIGKEVGEGGTPHLQGYLSLKAKTTRQGLVRKCPILKSAWIDIARGGPENNQKYCSKQGEYFEVGELRQGERSDLVELKDEIVDGKTLDEITMEKPIAYHQYGRVLSRIEEITLRRKFRTEMTEGIWYWGKTDVGKSHKAFEGYDPVSCYRWVPDAGWWDGYVGQEKVIMNDFRGQIPYGELLNLVDKWPYDVRRRYRGPCPFISKLVVVTSSMPPEGVYSNLAAGDGISQLLRRFKVIQVADWKKEVLGGNNALLTPSPPPAIPPIPYDTRYLLEISLLQRCLDALAVEELNERSLSWEQMSVLADTW